ncbi:TlpA disulfide reductase family protein [Tenacibaculum pacificus]|uniref:TlpA family protein disulfide reductase n=1 Tax=Tenacibaculum TaxID=104267 RepID=UPI0022F3E2D7|nr:TlpA disulfide reductase family protein [Tenacibaculum pacificus]WBX73185.1 TlpA disulfide reductase family protein [Tenacibaculum pacificus]
MIKKIVFVFVTMLLFSCSVENPTEFSKEALEDVFTSIDKKEEVKFRDILAKNKGKKIVIDVWASWCTDCLKSLPDVKKLQEKNPEVVFLYLSLDRDLDSWQEGVQRLNIKGQHYFMQSGWEGRFGKFLGLSWIPRYLVINEQGKIVVFNETKITDNLITKQAKK